MRALVTGGAGFIGSNLVRGLLRADWKVTVIDDFSTGRHENLPNGPGIEVIEEDITGPVDLGPLVAGSDVVFHLAAQVGNLRSIDDVLGDARNNVLATVRLLAACRGQGLKRFVFSASSATFGEPLSVPINDSDPQRPESFYGLSKLAAEKYVVMAAELLDLPAVGLRYFNVYGSPAAPAEYAGVIAAFRERLDRGLSLIIYGDGSQFRDFIHVDDVVRANILAAYRGVPGRTYNVGTGRRTTILELATIMAKLWGRDADIEFRPFRDGEVRRSVAQVSLAKAELGFEATIDVPTGLRLTFDLTT